VPPEPLSVPFDWVGPPSVPPTGPPPEELLLPAAAEDPPLDEVPAPPEDPAGEPDPPDPDAPDPDPPLADPDDDSLGMAFDPLLVPPMAVLPPLAAPEDPLELPPCSAGVGLPWLEEPQAPVTAIRRTPTPVEIRRFTELLLGDHRDGNHSKLINICCGLFGFMFEPVPPSSIHVSVTV